MTHGQALFCSHNDGTVYIYFGILGCGQKDVLFADPIVSSDAQAMSVLQRVSAIIIHLSVEEPIPECTVILVRVVPISPLNLE